MFHALLLIGHIDGGGDARGQSTQNRMVAGLKDGDTDGGEQHIVDCIACLLRTQHAGIIISEHCCSLLVLAQRLLLGRCSNPRTPSHCVYIEELIQIGQAGERSRSKTLKHITSVSPIRAVEVPFTSSWRLQRVQHTLGDMCVTGERGSHEVLSAKGERKGTRSKWMYLSNHKQHRFTFLWRLPLDSGFWFYVEQQEQQQQPI